MQLESTKGVSIIICCYNSAARLSKTIEHIAKQEIPAGISWELLIVNNNSSDNTTQVAQSEWNQYHLDIPFKIIDEVKAGLSHARLKGIQEAQYEYLLFCDDDNWLCSNYVATAYEVMEKDKHIGVLAGQGIAVADIPFPNWFYSNYIKYACGVLALESGDVSKRRWVWGAGMVLRKSVFNSLLVAGFNFKLSDRIGANLSSGGDVEICYWHLLVGYKIWYEEHLVFHHYISQSRLTKEYVLKLESGFKLSKTILKKYENNLNFIQSISFKQSIRLLFQILKDPYFFIGILTSMRGFRKYQKR